MKTSTSFISDSQIEKKLAPIEGGWALVTGASSGIGRDLARELARGGVNVVLVARSEEKLMALATEIMESFKVKTEVIALDLSKAKSVGTLARTLVEKEIEIDFLANNAGLGDFKNFSETSEKSAQSMIDLNITALTKLTHSFLGGMLARKKGYILQVASVAGFMPVPNYAVYGASKAYVLSFSQALNWELAASGVSSTALCPGATRTEFFAAAEQKTNKLLETTMMDSKTVAREGIVAAMERKDRVVPGLINKATAGLGQMLPGMLTKRIVAEAMA